MWHVIPYNIFGVKLYAVENYEGYILKYCDTRSDAEAECKKHNSGRTFVRYDI